MGFEARVNLTAAWDAHRMHRALRAVARTLRRPWIALRFRAWIGRLRFELWRHGARLELHAPSGVRFDSAPALKVYPGDREASTLHLRIGQDVRLGRGMTIEIYPAGDNRLELADGVDFHNNVRILMRGGAISLGPRTRVRDGVLLKSDGALDVGEGVTLGPFCALHCTGNIALGDLVGLGERVSIIDSDHEFDGVDLDFLKKDLNVSPVRVGRQTMIAIGSVLLRGAEIGANSVVAANSVVRGEVYPAASLLGGNPARQLKELNQLKEPGSGR